MKSTYSMKKFLLSLVCIVFGCGDTPRLNIFSIDFQEQKLETCPNIDKLGSTVFFKIKQTETLVLQIGEGLLQNADTGEVPITSKIPGSAQLYYRSFDKSLTSDYFCAPLPAVEPFLQTNIAALAGTLLISTKEETDDLGNTSYTHTFSIEDLIMKDESGQTVVSDTLTFGEFITEKKTDED